MLNAKRRTLLVILKFKSKRYLMKGTNTFLKVIFQQASIGSIISTKLVDFSTEARSVNFYDGDVNIHDICSMWTSDSRRCCLIHFMTNSSNLVYHQNNNLE